MIEFDGRPGVVKPDPEVLALVKNIVSYSGLELNFELRAEPKTSNASAYIENSRRILAFDPEYLKKIAAAADTDWARLGVLAHEIGHHLQGHLTDEEHAREDELAADRYAAFVLGLMGATQEQGQAHLTLMTEEASDSHPPKSERLAATRQGWERAQKLVVQRTPGAKNNACPIVRLDQPSERTARFVLLRDERFVPGELELAWGWEGTVRGWLRSGENVRRFAGHMDAKGLHLEEFAGCVILGSYRLNVDTANKLNETWSGTFTDNTASANQPARLLGAQAAPASGAKPVEKTTSGPR